MSGMPYNNTPIRRLPEHLPSLPSPQTTLGPASFQGGRSSQEVADQAFGRRLQVFMSLLWRFRRLILASLVLVEALALLFAFSATPIFQAASTIRISTYEPVLAATEVENVLQDKSKESNFLATQIQEIRSFSLVDQVLSDPEIYTAIEKTVSEEARQGKTLRDKNYRHSLEEIRAYLNLLEVTPVRRTSLVAISARAEDPILAARIANAHAAAYQDWARKKWIQGQSHSLGFLEGQADELREKVADLARDMADYAEENSIVAINKDENIVAQKMAKLNILLSEATVKRIEVEERYAQAKKKKVGNSAGFDDDSSQTMRSELAKLEASYAELSKKFTIKYPKMKQLAAQIEGLRGSLAERQVDLLDNLAAQARAAKKEEASLKDELEKQTSRAFELSKRQVQYNIMARELESSRELLQTVLRQVNETGLAVEGKSSNVAVVDYAVIPDRASFPNKTLIAILGLMLGGGLGLAVAVLLHVLDNTLRSPEALCELTGLANLGVVPSFESLPQRKALEPKKEALLSYGFEIGESAAPAEQAISALNLPASLAGSQAPIFLEDSHSLAAEAYRTVRTGILLSQAGEPPRTILVSSSRSGEGKTTSVLNLAACLASAGASVALLDADLRRPNVCKSLGAQEHLPGIVEVITGQRVLAEIERTDLMKRVSIFPAGTIPPNPSELLGSLEMAVLLDELANRFDYVLIDSPPILPVTDSIILSRYVDGVLLIVRGSSTPRRMVREAQSRLEQARARILGTLLNDLDYRKHEYRYYEAYYEYGEYGEQHSRDEGRPLRKKRHQGSDRLSERGNPAKDALPPEDSALGGAIGG